MNDFMDTLWFFIQTAIINSASAVDGVLSYFNFLGPETLIFLLAFFAVVLSSFLRRVYTTKRYEKLKKNFEYWHGLREEAMAHAEKEKGKGIAKNIDQAELNRAYYDYFFEGLLKSLVTTWLPLFLTLAYVNRFYASPMLVQKFGRPFLFMTGDHGVLPWDITGILWFFVSLALVVAGMICFKMSGLRKKC